MSAADRKSFVLKAYDKETREMIIHVNPKDLLSCKKQVRRIKCVQNHFSEIIKNIDDLPTYETIQKVMKILAAPESPAAIGIDE